MTTEPPRSELPPYSSGTRIAARDIAKLMAEHGRHIDDRYFIGALATLLGQEIGMRQISEQSSPEWSQITLKAVHGLIQATYYSVVSNPHLVAAAFAKADMDRIVRDQKAPAAEDPPPAASAP